MKKCKRCGETKSESEFHKDKNKKDGLVYYCKSCISKRSKRYRNTHPTEIAERNKTRYVGQKNFLNLLKTPCVKCGETRLYLIQFHHVNNDDKEIGVGCEAVSRSKSNIIKEIRKCVCLCSNCHTEFHWFYGKKPDVPVESLNVYLGGKLNEIQLQQNRVLETLSLSI